MEIIYQSIGIVRSPFTKLEDMSIQPTGEASAPGTAELFPQFAEGLKDLEGFTHVILLYHLHEVRRTDLTVMPFLGSEPRGVFATRAPTRPNPIGLSIVKLVRVERTGCTWGMWTSSMVRRCWTPAMRPGLRPTRGGPHGLAGGPTGRVRSVKSDRRFT